MRQLVDERDLSDRIQIDSAGTSSYHLGKPADQRMRSAAQERGLQLTSRSRMVAHRDFSEFDLIVAMDRDNYRELMRMCERFGGKVRLMSDYLDDSWPRDVPDPYYGGSEGFEEVLDMLQAACPRLLDELQGNCGPS